MQRSQTYVVPDTNFLLHGKPLREITPAMLGVPETFVWLFVRTVIRELDDKTHSQTSRLKRRATASLRDLREAISGRSAGRSMQAFTPIPPLDYGAMGFDPYVNDERILAEIAAFKERDSDAIIFLLTRDTGIELTATLHGIDLAIPTCDLTIVEEEDTTERELRNARRELEALRAAQPEMTLSFKDEAVELEMLVFPPLSESTLGEIVETLSAPETDSPMHASLLSTIMITQLQRNPDYEVALETYAGRLREIVPALWSSLGSVITVGLALRNNGDVEASDVSIELTIPSVVTPLESTPLKPAIPSKPPLYLERAGAIPAWMRALNLQNAGTLFQPSRLVARPYVPPTRSGPTILNDRRIGYWQQAIRQRRTLSLKPLLLQLEDHVPAFDVRYEIRGSNVPGVPAGHLLVRLSPISEADAIVKVYVALHHSTRELTDRPDEDDEFGSKSDEAD